MKRMISSTLIVFISTLSLISTDVVWKSAAKSIATPSMTQSQVTTQAGDRGWPRGYSLPSEAQIVLFQPQIASLGRSEARRRFCRGVLRRER